MNEAATVFLYVAAACVIFLTLLVGAAALFVVRGILEIRRTMQGFRREAERLLSVERRLERTSRLAGKWFFHLPGRLFEAWSERRYY